MLRQFSHGHQAVIYARVSISSQMVENQIAELREAPMRNGWHVALELSECGISGSKGRDQRPAFNDLIHRATRREFDIVMVWALSAWDARSSSCYGWDGRCQPGACVSRCVRRNLT